ncbi:MAG TPA: glycosyltransferase family 4 protein [Pyrinomonadaceae bacterium]|nr:glycosyltransferase family 4 protein [Pyrinomonadaceae bacterium]
MKILFYNHTGQISGAERVLLTILAGGERLRFIPVVLCPADGPLVSRVRELGVRTIAIDRLEARFTLRLDRLANYAASFVRLIRAARVAVINEAPDIIHANSIRAGLVMSMATIGLDVPVVWHVHDLLPRHTLSTAIRLFAASSQRNRLVAVSRAVANRFQGRLIHSFRGRIETIYNAVDIERFYPDPKSRKEIRRALGIEATKVIGIVGQLTPRKGQLELIEAFAEISCEFPDTVLLIVGEPLFNRDTEYAKSVANAARSFGIADRILFLGQREDTPAIMRALDLLVVNSRTEPFGLTVIEAMASGVPVLATAVDGIREIVRHGENGWLVKSLDRGALVKGMLTLLRDQSLRRQLGREGRREAIARYSTNRFLSEIEKLYCDVLESGELPQYEEGSQNFEVNLSSE